MNEQWKSAYKEGFADGYAAAKKEMNYGNFPPVYYGGGKPRTAVMETPNNPSTLPGFDPRSSVSSIRATAYPPVNNEHFVTGMSVSSSDC